MKYLLILQLYRSIRVHSDITYIDWSVVTQESTWPFKKRIDQKQKHPTESCALAKNKIFHESVRIDDSYNLRQHYFAGFVKTFGSFHLKNNNLLLKESSFVTLSIFLSNHSTKTIVIKYMSNLINLIGK